MRGGCSFGVRHPLLPPHGISIVLLRNATVPLLRSPIAESHAHQLPSVFATVRGETRHFPVLLKEVLRQRCRAGLLREPLGAPDAPAWRPNAHRRTLVIAGNVVGGSRPFVPRSPSLRCGARARRFCPANTKSGCPTCGGRGRGCAGAGRRTVARTTVPQGAGCPWPPVRCAGLQANPSPLRVHPLTAAPPPAGWPPCPSR